MVQGRMVLFDTSWTPVSKLREEENKVPLDKHICLGLI